MRYTSRSLCDGRTTADAGHGARQQEAHLLVRLGKTQRYSTLLYKPESAWHGHSGLEHHSVTLDLLAVSQKYIFD